jgi:aspartate/tyrosine/aromatic aminotransferase
LFETLEMAPPDAILGLTEAFNQDSSPDKINLTIGVYKDTSGTTPIFRAVKKAEERILGEESTKSYLAINGSKEYGAAVQRLIFGEDHEIVSLGRAVTAHTPGGTGALRVAAEFLKRLNPDATLWLSQPTWPNHPAIFEAAGLNTKSYPYYDADSKTLDFDAMTAALEEVEPGDTVLMHGCCHNPTGMDPDAEQWRQLAELLASRQALVFFDFAYQGLGNGLEEDAVGLRTFCTEGCEVLVSSSFSKNFGLYRERTGALTLVARDAEIAAKSMSVLKQVIRANYSNPPSHGAAIVTTILGDPELRADWEAEVKEMCARIADMRRQFVEKLKELGVTRDFSFLTTQNGMFSFSGLNPEQVKRLKDEYSIYIVGSGRINVASLTPGNIDAFCKAVSEVL